MQTQNSQLLPVAIIIGGVLVLLAALILAFSPMLWTDHLTTNKPVPTGCSIPYANAFVVRCPSWVSY